MSVPLFWKDICLHIMVVGSDALSPKRLALLYNLSVSFSKSSSRYTEQMGSWLPTIRDKPVGTIFKVKQPFYTEQMGS